MSNVVEFKLPNQAWSLDTQPADAWACRSPDGVLYMRDMKWEWVAMHPDVRKELGKMMTQLR